VGGDFPISVFEALPSRSLVIAVTIRPRYDKVDLPSLDDCLALRKGLAQLAAQLYPQPLLHSFFGIFGGIRPNILRSVHVICVVISRQIERFLKLSNSYLQIRY
jgi:hypothetical protein